MNDNGSTSGNGRVTDHEMEQVRVANESGRTPVVFIHGLWLLPSSWQRWADNFDAAGFAAVMPGWPDDPETVEEARENPEAMAKKSITEVADHFDEVIQELDKKPAVVGHSFGGLMTEILAGRGVAAASVAISPAPFRGVLPLPLSALRAGSPVLKNPATGTGRSHSPMSSSATRSRTLSTRTRPRSSSRRLPCPRPESRSSRRRPRT